MDCASSLFQDLQCAVDKGNVNALVGEGQRSAVCLEKVQTPIKPFSSSPFFASPNQIPI